MGYGVSYGLNYRDLAAMEHCFWIADKSGFPLNAFLTFTPPRDMAAEARPRKFGQYRGHLGQELAIRNGCPFIALFIREWKLEDENDAGEHLHCLIHLPNNEAMRIAAAVAAEHVKIEWNDGTTHGDFSRLLYVQKQRDHHAEGLVKVNRKPHLERETPAPINGRRWSASSPLHGLVKQDRKIFVYPSNKKFLKPPNYKPKAALRLVVNNPVVLAPFDPVTWWAAIPPRPAPSPLIQTLPPERQKRQPARVKKPAGQCELFNLPNWRELIEPLGRTDAERARVLGVSRPHLTNIKNGFFEPSAELARRILQMAQGVAA